MLVGVRLGWVVSTGGEVAGVVSSTCGGDVAGGCVGEGELAAGWAAGVDGH